MAFPPLTILRIIGHLMAAGLLLSTALVIKLFNWLIRNLVALIRIATGATIERDLVKFHGQRESVEPIYENNQPKLGFVDEKLTRKRSDFPISSEDLIEKAKLLTSPEVAFGSKNPDLLAQDFQFVFPIVGPLEKAEFCTIYGGFKMNEAFPNRASNYFGFTVDPLEPNRVWFFARSTMTHTGTLKFGSQHFAPTGKEIVNTPQVLSMSFDNEGRCYKFTGGYSIDRTVGNCGGLGGVFGIIHALGGSLPFPESKPWIPSLEWEALGKHIPEIGKEWKKITSIFDK